MGATSSRSNDFRSLGQVIFLFSGCKLALANTSRHQATLALASGSCEKVSLCTPYFGG